MKRFYISSNIDNKSEVIIDGGEFLHLSQVLRTKIGEEVICFCGNEFEYESKVTAIGKKQANLSVLNKTICKSNPKASVTVYQAMLKGEKLDYLVQKLTELGVTNLCLFSSKFTIAKSTDAKIDRLNKISIEACKQCGRTIPLNIKILNSFVDVAKNLLKYDTILFAYEKARDDINSVNLSGKIALVIGSEGGFSQDEIDCLDKKIKVISLGNRILRAETASSVLAGYVMLKLGDKI